MDSHVCFRGKERELARVKMHDVGMEDHGMPFMFGSFDFDGSGQGWGVVINMEFVKRLLGVFKCERLRQIGGQACWVTHCHDRIHKVEPLFPREGETFDVDAWASALRVSQEAEVS